MIPAEIILLANSHIRQTVAGRPFSDWLADNWHVWTRFEKEAEAIWASGRTHWSSRTIGEFLRHQTALSDTGHPWKLNDQAWPCFARLWAIVHPDKPLFEIREKAAA